MLQRRKTGDVLVRKPKEGYAKFCTSAGYDLLPPGRWSFGFGTLAAVAAEME